MATAAPIANLTGGRLLLRNMMYGLAAQCTPLPVSLISIPVLIRGLGVDRFGVLTLAWMVVSYFNLFDLGLGRALTQLVAERLGKDDSEEVPSLIWTSLFLMGLLGLVAGAAFALLAPVLVQHALKIPGGLQRETLVTFYLLAFSVPVVILTSGLSGVLAAYQRFEIINGIRIPMSLFMFLSPLAVLPFSHSLVHVVAVLVAGRTLAMVAHLLWSFRVTPRLRYLTRPRLSLVGPLMRFGSWMTISNIVGPMMIYLDRFLLGSLISVAAVAYYATPFDILAKTQAIPGAVVAVMFPAFATSFVQERSRAAHLFVRTCKYLFIALLPITLIFIALAYPGLNAWLGGEFAQHSAPILRWLAIGVLVNSLAQVPFAFLQGVKRPDLTAKLHLLELPFYLLTLWWFVHAFGVVGAAYAWVLRSVLDAAVLLVMSKRFLPSGKSLVQPAALGSVVALGACLVLMVPATNFARVALLTVLLLGFVVVTWLKLLPSQERAIFLDSFRQVRSPAALGIVPKDADSVIT